jgi:membrane protease subunit HflK
MPWNNGGPNPWGNAGGGSGGASGGGSNGGQPPNGPWGSGGGSEPPPNGRPSGPFGSGGRPLPDLERLIAQAQAFVRRILRRGAGGGGGPGAANGRIVLLAAAALAVIWLAEGFYRVQPDEEGVVLRFGAYAYLTPPGLHWHLPWPIESVERPAVTRINRTEIGFRSAGSGRIESGTDSSGRDVTAESLMLTGDENIIDIDIVVLWRISNAPDYLFNTRDPDNLVKAVTESSIREVIGRTPIQPALTELRAQIESDVLHQSQQILDRYHAGVEVTQVQLQKVDPPAAVIESFRDVQRANTDAERMRNEADAYRNDIVPRARGEAARVVAEGQGAKQAMVAEATGQSQRFDSVLAAYQAAKDITLRRMYLDTMQDILQHAQPLVVDDKLKGLVPFLPLSVPPPVAPAQPHPNGPATPGTGTSATSPVGASR